MFTYNFTLLQNFLKKIEAVILRNIDFESLLFGYYYT